ncbi:hypothetical protein HMN09_00778500 [Mycena chlorophos]|uniref:Uncharacterized protein n=1 Tax=Mycena chlorophos TaxID=658473 RepID=A0A8H6SWM3_MYCCL|nr:hypothetical protein HMN09_00778500 [Mycena chlorophos]
MEEANAMMHLVELDTELLAVPSPLPFPPAHSLMYDSDDDDDDSPSPLQLGRRSSVDSLNQLVLGASSNSFLATLNGTDDSKLHALSNATLALTIGDQIALLTTPDEEEEDRDQHLSSERARLAELRSMVDYIAPIEENVLQTRPFSHSTPEAVDLNALVVILCRQAQTPMQRRHGRLFAPKSYDNSATPCENPSLVEQRPVSPPDMPTYPL